MERRPPVRAASALAGSVRTPSAPAPAAFPAEIPAALAAIDAASSPEALAGLHRALDALAAHRFEADPCVPELQALCTGYRDRIFRRALCLAEAELGPPPGPWAAACVGSQGRCEQTLATDQDNLLVFQEAAHRPYFLQFGAVVNQFLARAGIARCSGGIMMGEEAWQGTVAQWKARIDRTAAFDDAGVPQRRQLLRLIILSDVRFLRGTELLVAEIASHVFGRLRDNVPALYEMARASVTLPLGSGGSVGWAPSAAAPTGACWTSNGSAGRPWYWRCACWRSSMGSPRPTRWTGSAPSAAGGGSGKGSRRTSSRPMRS